MKACQSPVLTSQSNSATSDRLRFWNFLQQIGEFIVQKIFQQYELQIEQITDRKGNTCWEVHDPDGQQILRFYSESELRSWLDRY